MNEIVFSGIQPTGSLHIGNYFGAMANWVKLQNENKGQNIFCIVDLHAFTIPNSSIKESVFEVAAACIAIGIDPQKSILFVQSHVHQHAELAWILDCITPVGWLNRMTQYKEKSVRFATLGLYSYPVLMAADILLYDATLVPVGEDQMQHLELTCDILKAFNAKYNSQFFHEPKSISPKILARVMSLTDGKKKMSKSEISDDSRINLTDKDDLIVKKIKSAKTDSIIGFENLDERPEAKNLIELYSAISGEPIQEICNRTPNFAELKRNLADAMVSFISPIRSRIVCTTKADANHFLKLGQEKAQNIAEKKMNELRNLINI